VARIEEAPGSEPAHGARADPDHVPPMPVPHLALPPARREPYFGTFSKLPNCEFVVASDESRAVMRSASRYAYIW